MGSFFFIEDLQESGFWYKFQYIIQNADTIHFTQKFFFLLNKNLII